MSNDISTMYTKEENLKNGKSGYFRAYKEKRDIIPPHKYGQFIFNKKRGKKK